ncbi:MAG: preprotein translocase subunit SecG [Myxococcota bacterium]
MLQTVTTIVHLLSCIVLVTVILLQAGKGSGLASGFGGAGGGTQVFGSQGAGGFLEKATVFVAAIFMTSSLGLAYLSSQPSSVMPTTASEQQQQQQNQGEDIVGGSGADSSDEGSGSSGE